MMAGGCLWSIIFVSSRSTVYGFFFSFGAGFVSALDFEGMVWGCNKHNTRHTLVSKVGISDDGVMVWLRIE